MENRWKTNEGSGNEQIIESLLKKNYETRDYRVSSRLRRTWDSLPVKEKRIISINLVKNGLLPKEAGLVMEVFDGRLVGIEKISYGQM